MAAPQQNQLPTLIANIRKQLSTAQIWQVLRLLKMHVNQAKKTIAPIYFKSDSHLRFPQHNISAVDYDGADNVVTVVINFMSLIGGTGILPLYYSELLLKQQRENDYSLLDLIDSLQQPSIWYYYQAFEQSRIYLYQENYQLGISKTNPANELVTSLSSSFLLTDANQKTLNALLAQFSNRVKSVNGLTEILHQCLRLPIFIQEFTKHKVFLATYETTRLKHEAGANNALSHSFTLGETIRMDALHFTIFVKLQSDQKLEYFKYHKIWRQLINQLTRWYLKTNYHFEIKFIFTDYIVNRLGIDFYL